MIGVRCGGVKAIAESQGLLRFKLVADVAVSEIYGLDRAACDDDCDNAGASTLWSMCFLEIRPEAGQPRAMNEAGMISLS